MNRSIHLIAVTLIACLGPAGLAWSAEPPPKPTGLTVTSTQSYTVTGRTGTGSFVVAWKPAMTNPIPATATTPAIPASPWVSHIFALSPKNCTFQGVAAAGPGFWQRDYLQAPYEMQLTCTRCGYPLQINVYSKSTSSYVAKSSPATIKGDFMPCPTK